MTDRSIRARLWARHFLFLVCLHALAPKASAAPQEDPPNVVIILADDLGYGDLGVYGARGWKTPNIDRMAREGVRFTSFYVSEPVCSASRTSLLTGCYASRLGIHGALGPKATHGIHRDETTIAEVLRPRGYATAVFGKWHLGHHAAFLPLKHGFDEYFGLPYSNDMWPRHPTSGTDFPPLPLIDGDRVVESMPDQTKLTTWYTERAVKFIEKNRERPFFLYLAHSMPHVPLHVSERWRGSSAAGLYGDVIQEIDWSVGEVLGALERNGLAERTLVIFTSDNGPWLSYGNHAGSAGPLREGKGTVWEGGVRVPFIARWPGKIPAGTSQSEPAMTIDILPTLARIAAAELPGRPIDGKDIGPLLRGEPGAKSPHEALFFYYKEGELQAARAGRWKLILPHTYRTLEGKPGGKDGKPAEYVERRAGLELYDLEADPGETMNIAAAHPDVVRRLETLVEACRDDIGDSLTKRQGKNARQPGKIETGATAVQPVKERPNFVFIFTDDFSRAEGNRIPDASGRENHGTAAALQVVHGRGEKRAAQFDGRGFIEIARSPSLDCAGRAWSIEAVLKAAKPAGVIVARGGKLQGYTLYLDGGRPALAVTAGGRTTTLIGPKPIAGKWTHVAGVIGSDRSLVLHVNGEVVASSALPGFIPRDPTEAMQVGADEESPVTAYPEPARFTGLLEAVRIYSGELSAEAIQKAAAEGQD